MVGWEDGPVVVRPDPFRQAWPQPAGPGGGQAAPPLVTRRHDGDLLWLEPGAARVRPLVGGAAQPGRPRFVDRRLSLEIPGRRLEKRSSSVGGLVHVRPRRRRIHWMVRITKAHPREERTIGSTQPLRGL